MAGGTARGPRIARFSLLDELVARKARNLIHAVLMHLDLVVAGGTRSRIDRRLVRGQVVTLIAGQVHLGRHMVLMPD